MSVDMLQPGELGIRERRTWKSWQLACACLVALLVGMAIGHGGASSAGATSAVYTPPPPSGSTSGAGGGSTASSTSGSSLPGGGSPSTTTLPAATTTLPLSTVLLPQVTARGPAVTPSFRAGSAPWHIGWAYDCRSAPGSTGTFQVFPLGAGQSPSPAGAVVNASGATGQGVTAVNSTGTEELTIRTPAQCIWAVKVTGTG